jgi:parallel beta-helix repeat protein
MELAGTPHAPIVINGDANFSATALAQGWPGDGTWWNPFIIDGLDIDRGGTGGHCINIANTRVNFTISNCILTGANVSGGAGINLENVTYGVLIGNTLYNNVYNIYLTESHSVLIKSNTATDSSYSISLRYSSSSNVLVDNNCSFNSNRGINLESGSAFNTVVNNTCSNNIYGIVLYNVSSNAVTNNTFNSNSGHGIHLNRAGFNTIAENACNDNQYGIYFISSSNDNNVMDNELNDNIYGMYLQNCEFDTIASNTFSNNGNGIRFWDGEYNTMAENTFNNNNDGIRLEWSNYNTMTNNTFTSNSLGINFVRGNYNTMTNNTFTNNSHGILFHQYAGFNVIHWNVFYENSVYNCHNSGIGNSFDHNYWSDYSGSLGLYDADRDGIGDTAYQNRGIADQHPLMLWPNRPPLVWIETPKNQVIEHGETLSYQLNVRAYSVKGVKEWWLNDTKHFIHSGHQSTDLVIFSFGLPVGVYGVEVQIRDLYDNALHSSFTVVVRDTTPPVWIIRPTDQKLSYGETLDMQFPASDLSGIDWTLDDTTHFTLGATHYSGGSTARIMNLALLEPGVYVLNLTAADPYDNSLSAIFTVTVEAVEQETTTTTATTTQTTSATLEGIDPTVTFVIGTGVGGAAVIVIVLAVLRRRGGE